MSFTAKEFLFAYFEYLNSISQTTIIKEVLESKDHDAWTTETLIMIADAEFEDMKKVNNMTLSLSEVLYQIQINNRDKLIEKILDK